MRIGSDWVGHDRRLWTVSFLAGLYSDVLVDGFAAGGKSVADSRWVVLEDDEGKVRALGQLRVKATTMHGLSTTARPKCVAARTISASPARLGCGTTGSPLSGYDACWLTRAAGQEK